MMKQILTKDNLELLKSKINPENTKQYRSLQKDISKDKKALDILKNTLMDPSSHLRISAIEAISNSNLDCSYDLIYERLLYDDF